MSAITDLMAEAIAGILTSPLAGPVVYLPQNGPPVTIQGIFDTTTGGRGESSAGRLYVRQSDLPKEAKKMDVVTIDGLDYEVRSDPWRENRDGVGGVFLTLRVRG